MVLPIFPWGKRYAMISLIDNPYGEGRTMSDTGLYQDLLGIVAPWNVDSVTMDIDKKRVDMTVSHPPKILFACPES